METNVRQSLLLRILPPPSDWKGPSEVVCGLGGYPWFKKIEQAGIGYQNMVRRRRGEVVEEEKKKVDEEEVIAEEKQA